jgi:hypothetical protein
MEILEIGPFGAHVDANGIKLLREKNSTSMTSGEGASAVNLLLHVMSTETLKVLPPKISLHPFEVTFTKERVMYLRRQKDTGDGIAFTFREGDDLINMVKQSSQKMTDMSTIDGGARSGKSHYQVPDPIISGR